MRIVNVYSTTGAVRPVDTPVLLGESAVMELLRAEIETAARSDAKLLILGETGAGKEVVARVLHAASARGRRPFVAVNCAGVPDQLLESELFGHVRGSFTDAYRDKPGLAAAAEDGTLFLDEVGEMSPRMQGVLLRFIETGEIHRIGDDHPGTQADVRVIAATNRDLRARVAAGEFRDDLFYRLNVLSVAVPPLRERGSDVLLLFRYFLAAFSHAHGHEPPALEPEAERLLLQYGWPGNVRELRNAAERVAVRQVAATVAAADLPQEIRLPLTRTSFDRRTDAAPASIEFPAVDAAWDQMVRGGRSFWAIVHPRFINRELTKADVRELIRRGLVETGGSYRKVVALFRLPPDDYKRFLSFLSQHDCHLSFHQFRSGK
jgi:transcriptional regulator with PAS, ATPase and Fis domain